MSATRSLSQIRGVAEAGPGHNSAAMDVDMFHAMSARDNALIEDEVLSGGNSSAFTYSFSLQGTMVQGVSVIGARHLAAHYGGIKHRLVASISKTGPRFVSITYPGADVKAMQYQVAVIEEMTDEPDFYTIIVEVTDVKKGITEQTEITENRMERKSRKNKREGDPDEYYERPHYQRIAQSKAFRNAVLNILPQDFVAKFKADSVAAKQNVDLTRDLLDERRDAVVRYATGKAIPINRQALAALDMTQLSGLRDAAGDGLEAFKHALAVAGCVGNFTPLREVPLVEQANGVPLVDLKGGQDGEAVPVPGAAVEAEASQEPAATNQGSSIRRVDLSKPLEAMGVWIETYGFQEAHRLAAKQGWTIPQAMTPEEHREAEKPPLEASMPGGSASGDEGPDAAPYDGEVRQPRGAAGNERRETRATPRGETRGARRDGNGDGNGAGEAGDLFSGKERPGKRDN